jgi:hypothetical protein
MRTTSQKRARRSSATAASSNTSTRNTTPSNSEEKDASVGTSISASREDWNPALRLPTELIYTITAIAIGEYIGDMILFPSRLLTWDAILTLLHVSRTFRGCTIKLLYHLWGDTFIREKTRYVWRFLFSFFFFRSRHSSRRADRARALCSIIGNYKPTHHTFRQLTYEARAAPHSFTSRDDQPKLLSARVVRHPISPLARIWSAYIRNTATANAVLLDAEKDWRRVDFEAVYAARDLQVIMNSYAEIPAGVRHLLLGRVMHYTMTQAAIWTKRQSSSASWFDFDVPPPLTHIYYFSQ